MSKIIEFFGPPGSGKTRLIKLSKKYLKENKITVISRKEVEDLGFKKWLCRKNEFMYSTEKKMIKTLLNILPKELGRRLTNSLFLIDRYHYYEDILTDFRIKDLEVLKILFDLIDKKYTNK